MADEDQDPDESEEGKSFRDRVEEIREQREEGEGGGPPGGMEEMMGGGGGPGGMGGGNPFAQMMGGMMGGGPGGMGGGGRGGPGVDTESIEREMELLRDEVKEATRELRRIADALEDD